MTIRAAQTADAAALCKVLNPIIARGGTTAHRHPFTAERMIAELIAPPLGISCFVAIVDASVVGVQALEWSDPAWPGTDKLPADWGIISTFVAVDRQGTGVGRRLFTPTLHAARQAGVGAINATIRRENTGGRQFYDRLGFVDDNADAATISKRYDLTSDRS